MKYVLGHLGAILQLIKGTLRNKAGLEDRGSISYILS